MTDHRLVEFVWLPTFERTSQRLLGEEDRRTIEAELCRDLEAGTLIKRTGGFRKLRHALEGGGKGKKGTLTRKEENELRKLATDLKNEDC